MHLMELLGDVGHVESCFSLFGDSVVPVQDSWTARTNLTIHSEIDLDAPNGTPR
jgi:hypothetical protein